MTTALDQASYQLSLWAMPFECIQISQIIFVHSELLMEGMAKCQRIMGLLAPSTPIDQTSFDERI